MESKNNNKENHSEYAQFYIDSPAILLEDPKLSPEYIEAFLKPDKHPVSEFCENTTTYD